MFDQGNCIFLLLARSVNIREEEWYVVPTHKSHKTRVIKEVGISLLFPSVGCLVRFLTLIHS
jgi:hypothetical protein